CAAARAAAHTAEQAAAGWREPLDPDDARAALEIARAKEGSFLKVFSGAWRQVKGTVRSRFDGGRRAVPVTVTQALALLVEAQSAAAEADRLAAAARSGWGYPDPVALLDRLGAARRTDDRAVLAVHDALARSEDDRLARGLAEAGSRLSVLAEQLDGLLVDVDDLPLGALADLLDGLAGPAGAAGLRALAPALRALEEHPSVASALRRLPVPPAAVEHAVAAAALDDVRAQVPAVGGFDGRDLAEAVGRVQELLPRLFASDAEVVVARVRARFLAGVAHATRSVTGMTPTERAAKQAWTAGRRELEHEFGKVMRYRSIRDLASGDPGAVVAALRPVWLMSPTSVSDTLPLDPSLFDVVVYDEASQIPVEEAVPAMHRAEQVVVVGDQMQLPPTQYFSTRPGDDVPAEAPEGAEDPDDDRVGVVLDGDSFLAQSAVRLPSTMLTWHYRSRFEALIGFSNAAFYASRLSTVPDRTVVPGARPEVVAHLAAADDAGGDPAAVDPAEVEAGLDALLSRSISTHRAVGAVYRRRTNPGEAAYIAALVRALLARRTGLTIGVVAFSEAQQTMIEKAVDRLAEADPEFARAYEAEIAREDDDQFVGLFVKNLENVQGDERDVILMSVCYAPGPDGRMAMNFGPINTRGGEKRLNVIFSRARRHMGIVSTIGPEAVTNTYNDGASTLRRFLAYAQAVSAGDDAGAAGGVAVTRDVGQSRFRADLALRRPGDAEHRVAVLVDTPARTAAEAVDERVLSHPAVLRAAGWDVVHVLTKDWFEDPATVVRTLAERVGAGAD
ncbi:AAA domain-containing protein, partial [Kineosporia sp. R_H_3]|uniref:AAA domain-containing protein n=1 Tax=Kineosporia sp. R_H_3 TaxID=1961848 RepID=UPI0018E9DD08